MQIILSHQKHVTKMKRGQQLCNQGDLRVTLDLILMEACCELNCIYREASRFTSLYINKSNSMNKIYAYSRQLKIKFLPLKRREIHKYLNLAHVAESLSPEYLTLPLCISSR